MQQTAGWAPRTPGHIPSQNVPVLEVIGKQGYPGQQYTLAVCPASLWEQY